MANQLDYTNYDFDELVQNLIDRLKTSDAWKDTYISSTGYTIIEQYAYVINMLLYAIERRAEECYLSTARNRSSIINLVSLLNYSPKRAVSSAGQVQFSIATAVAGRVWIPQYTVVKNSSGVKFVTTAESVIEIGNTTSAEIDVMQGTKLTLANISAGTANMEINIENTKIENDTHTSIRSFLVYVDGRLWERVTSFLASNSTSEYYILRHELDDTLTVVFGDNIRGKIPPAGTQIDVVYIESDGLDGNIYETGKVTTVESPSIEYTYLDSGSIEQEDSVTVSVTNTTQLIGGDDAESTEEIRNEAPNVFRTGDRLVTKLDFKAFLLNYPSIAEVNAWGELEELNGASSNFAMFNVVRICLLIEGWQHPTIDVKNLLTTALYDKSMMTVKYEFIQATVLNIVVAMDVVVYEKYGLSSTSSQIESVLEDAFVLGVTAVLGESKRISNLIDNVDSLAAVKYHHMVLEVREELTTTYSSGYWGAELSSDTIDPGTVNIYVGSTLVASDVQQDVDPTMGDIVGSASGYTVSGTIDYDTMELLADISPTPDEVVVARYQQDADHDVIVDNNGICKLHSVDIQSIAYPA